MRSPRLTTASVGVAFVLAGTLVAVPRRRPGSGRYRVDRRSLASLLAAMKQRSCRRSMSKLDPIDM
jgi:hypothetical protein